MNILLKNLLAAGTAAAVLSTTAFAAAVYRNFFDDIFVINRPDGAGYTIKMSDGSGSAVHISFSDGGSYEFRLSKDAVSGDNYILLIGTADSDTAESLANIRVYSLGDKLAVLEKINGAESEEALSGVLKENAEVLELNRDLVYDAQTGGDAVIDSELNAIAKSVFGTKFIDMQSFYTVVYNTRGLLLLNSAKDDAEAESIDEKYRDYLNFKTFDGYDLIADFESEIYPYYIGKNKTTAKEAQESFGEYAFLCAISKTENYRQVTDIFDKYSKFVTFDLTAIFLLPMPAI